MVGHHVGRGIGVAVRDGVVDDFRRGGLGVVAAAQQLHDGIRIVGRIVVDRHRPVEVAAAGRGEVHRDGLGSARRNRDLIDVRLEEGVAGAGEFDVADVERHVAGVGHRHGHVRSHAHADLAEVQRVRGVLDVGREDAEVVLVRSHQRVADVLRIEIGGDEGERVVAAGQRRERHVGGERQGFIHSGPVRVGARRQVAGGDHGGTGAEDVAVAGDDEAAVEVLDVPRDGQSVGRHVREEDVRSGGASRRLVRADEDGGDVGAFHVVVVHGEAHEPAEGAVHLVGAEAGDGIHRILGPFRLVVDRGRIGHGGQAAQRHVHVEVAAAGAGADGVGGIFLADALHQEDGIVAIERGHLRVGVVRLGQQGGVGARIHDHEGAARVQRLGG